MVQTLNTSTLLRIVFVIYLFMKIYQQHSQKNSILGLTEIERNIILLKIYKILVMHLKKIYLRCKFKKQIFINRIKNVVCNYFNKYLIGNY